MDIVDAAHDNSTVTHEFGYIYHLQEGSILDDGDDLAEQCRDNFLVGLRKNDIPQRLQEGKALGLGCFKLSLRDGVQAAAEDFSHDSGGEQGDGKHGNSNLIALDGEIDPEDPKQVWCTAEKLCIYGNKRGGPLERSVRVGADQGQNSAEKHADDGGKYRDGNGHGKTLQHKSDIGKGKNLIKQS